MECKVKIKLTAENVNYFVESVSSSLGFHRAGMKQGKAKDDIKCSWNICTGKEKTQCPHQQKLFAHILKVKDCTEAHWHILQGSKPAYPLSLF